MVVVLGAILQVTVGYAMFVSLSRSAGNGRVCYVRRFDAISQVTVGYAIFVLFSGSAGNGRVCYVRRFVAISRVTVGYAVFVRIREKLDAQLPNAAYICSTLYVRLLLYILARWRICAAAHLDNGWGPKTQTRLFSKMLVNTCKTHVYNSFDRIVKAMHKIVDETREVNLKRSLATSIAYAPAADLSALKRLRRNNQ